MWGRILEILARKAAQGVDVRVMYDGTCEFSTLPRDYPRRLEALGIRCKVFAPVTPFVSTHYNYRDHRKFSRRWPRRLYRRRESGRRVHQPH